MKISKLTEFFPTRYSDNIQDSNSVSDLVFLQPNSTEYNNHHIHLDQRLTLDHIPITIDISIIKKHIYTTKQSLIKNSEEEDYFIEDLTNFIKNLKMDFILDNNTLEEIINSLVINVNNIWYKHSKKVNIMKHSKVWWDDNCQRDLNMYRQSK